MKKLLITMILGLIILTGCSNSDYISESESGNRFFKTGNNYVISDNRYYEIVDSETNNIYIVNNGAYGASLTPLLDSDGKPMKYKLNKED